MKHLLPGKVELMIFVSLAVLCTGVVAATPQVDIALALLSVPVFITCAVMGLHRNWKLAEVREESRRPVRTIQSSTEEVA